ncbi:uncharacterized protein A4U43_C07F12310 [Asparagus officinalis]|uniref:RING-CH-type domain-containing protein n=1 Tax=Asparagus officinalis TaxID=4686 RepID=A0A5P1EBE7_ASPOF|nr:uncharacterized protein A4U43_C07F12310 [Asparagus officinalis]
MSSSPARSPSVSDGGGRRSRDAEEEGDGGEEEVNGEEEGHVQGGHDDDVEPQLPHDDDSGATGAKKVEAVNAIAKEQGHDALLHYSDQDQAGGNFGHQNHQQPTSSLDLEFLFQLKLYGFQFAHRRCIQRWCDEKGSTVCEICLQKFEPGYTVPPKLALLDIAVTIRGSLEVPRLNYESQNTGLIDEESDNDYPGCSPPSHPSAALFRTIALIFMVLILARHLVIVLATGEGNYPFAAATVLLLRASGIFLPFYCIMRIIAAIQKKQQQHLYRTHRRDASAIQRVEEGELQQHVIQIHS